MNVKKYIYMAFAALAFFSAAVSCKDDETEDKDYLNGNLSIEEGFIRFVSPNQIMKIYPYGITHPEGKDLGLYYKTSIMSTYDTVYFANSSDSRYKPLPTERHCASFYVYAPDSLDTFSVYAYVYASDYDNYYSSSSSGVFTVVDPQESIPQISFTAFLPSVTDSRDGTKYNYVTLGGLDWMTRNLSYAGTEDYPLGSPYKQCVAMQGVLGMYYNWTEAQTACPAGWRLPSSNEWENAAEGGAGSMMVDAYFNENKMWEFWPDVKITNTTGLSIIPSGYYISSSKNEFTGADAYACFWTSDSSPMDPSQGMYRYIYMKENDLKTAVVDKNTVSMCIRCVREHK